MTPAATQLGILCDPGHQDDLGQGGGRLCHVLSEALHGLLVAGIECDGPIEAESGVSLGELGRGAGAVDELALEEQDDDAAAEDRDPEHSEGPRSCAGGCLRGCGRSAHLYRSRLRGRFRARGDEIARN